MYLFGASGHAKVIIDVLESNRISVLGLFDDDQSKKKLNNIQIISKKEIQYPIIVSIGNNKIRKKVAKRLNGKFGKAIDTSAVVSENSSIGVGTVVMPNAVVNSNTKIGMHCIVNTASVIEHDCAIEDYVHVSPNATLCGNVTVGEGSHIGASAVVIQGINIGKWVTVGAGAVVIEDIPDYAVVVGNPGKTIRINEKEVIKNEQ